MITLFPLVDGHSRWTTIGKLTSYVLLWTFPLSPPSPPTPPPGSLYLFAQRRRTKRVVKDQTSIQFNNGESLAINQLKNKKERCEIC